MVSFTPEIPFISARRQDRNEMFMAIACFGVQLLNGNVVLSNRKWEIKNGDPILEVDMEKRAYPSQYIVII